MKKTMILTAIVIVGTGTAVFGQDLTPAQVPSVIVNNFQQAFPKATDVEWEMSKGLYEVEFDGTAGEDHEVRYDASGKLVRHKEELQASALPATVNAALQKEYAGYVFNDVERITEGTKIIYKLEAKKGAEEWNLTLDENGKTLSKKAD